VISDFDVVQEWTTALQYDYFTQPLQEALRAAFPDAAVTGPFEIPTGWEMGIHIEGRPRAAIRQHLPSDWLWAVFPPSKYEAAFTDTAKLMAALKEQMGSMR